MAVAGIKKERPDASLFFFANGASGKLEMMKKKLAYFVDMFAFDASLDMADARRRHGDDVCIQ